MSFLRGQYIFRLLYPGLRHVDLSGVSIHTKSAHRNSEAEDYEPYTAERLDDIPEGFKLLSKPFNLHSYDFSSKEVR